MEGARDGTEGLHAEQAIGMLREAKVRLSQGEKIGRIYRGSRSRATTGGAAKAQRLKDLERENQRLKRASTRSSKDELLNGEIFTTLREAEVLIESWRRHYNAVRPHASPGYRPPAP